MWGVELRTHGHVHSSIGAMVLHTNSTHRVVGRTLWQSMSQWITPPTFEAADAELERLLNEGYAQALAILRRNRGALDALIETLLERNTIRGEEVRGIVERLGDAEDVRARDAQQAEFL